MNSDDEKWMEQTYDIAQVGFQKNLPCVGCLIVYKGEVVGR
jgi:pyrimidine deaminase RibD-like protein